MGKGKGFLIKWLVVIGDILMMNVLFFLICFCLVKPIDPEMINKKSELFLLLNACYFFALYFIPVKISERTLFVEEIVKRASSLVLLHLLMFVACLLLFSFHIRHVESIIVFYAVFFVLFNLWRIIFRQSLKAYRSSGHNFQRVVIVGAGKNGLELYEEMSQQEFYGYKVMGVFDDNRSLKKQIPQYKGALSGVEQFCIENLVDEIYCTLPSSQDEKITRLLNFAEKNMIRFYIVPEFYRYVKKRLTLGNIDHLPVIALRDEPLQYWHNRLLKNFFDISFSLMILLLVFPWLYLILAVFIKLSSPGPVIFKQLRTGLYGKEFYCYKFRSMAMNCDADEKQAEKDDPRTTRIGEFIRRTNLDEIPQFLNVLNGDMSVVGPRPHMLKHTEMYSKLIDKYMVRHLVKPGITGWAQVTGYRGETKNVQQMEERVKRDVWYIENYSLLLDAKIVYRTIINMFKGDSNAY